MKKLIRLTESDLHRIVENAVRRTINEDKWYGNNESDYVNDDDEIERPNYYRRCIEISDMLNSIRNYLGDITYNNPRVESKAKELLQCIATLNRAIYPTSPFIRACMQNAGNTWTRLKNGKIRDANNKRSDKYWAVNGINHANNRSLLPNPDDYNNDDF